MTWILSTNNIEFSPTSHYFAALAKTPNGGFHLHTLRNSSDNVHCRADCDKERNSFSIYTVLMEEGMECKHEIFEQN